MYKKAMLPKYFMSKTKHSPANGVVLNINNNSITVKSINLKLLL